MTKLEVQNQILAGEHATWNELVSIFDLSETPTMGLTVREAFLVVAFRDRKKGWGLSAAPTVTKDTALRTIAESYREAPLSSLDAALIHEDGSVTYSSIPVDSSEVPGIVSLPVALVFVGPNTIGWADEVAIIPANVRILADLVGRSEDEESTFVEEFAVTAAHSRIEKLSAN